MRFSPQLDDDGAEILPGFILQIPAGSLFFAGALIVNQAVPAAFRAIFRDLRLRGHAGDAEGATRSAAGADLDEHNEISGAEFSHAGGAEKTQSQDRPAEASSDTDHFAPFGRCGRKILNDFTSQFRVPERVPEANQACSCRR